MTSVKVSYMKRIIFILSGIFFLLAFANIFIDAQNNGANVTAADAAKPTSGFWFVLHRQSNKEELLHGILGDRGQSTIVREFIVKTGIPGERPTPLPQLLGREYWLLTKKSESFENPETSPYFLSLDIPVSEEAPFGPTPYAECQGQCNWQLPGEFGLHGVGGDDTKLAVENPGSSGCIRHTDADITYLYSLFDPTTQEIRYYIEDN